MYLTKYGWGSGALTPSPVAQRPKETLNMAILSIPLPCGKTALIDDADWPLVAPYRWHSHRGKNGVVYVRSLLKQPNGRRKVLYLHRLITNAPPKTEVDHDNHDGLDNRRANLVVTDGCGNMANSRGHRDSTSGVKGVSFYGGLWHAEIMRRGRRIRVHSFPSLEEAVRARQELEQATEGRNC